MASSASKGQSSGRVSKRGAPSRQASDATTPPLVRRGRASDNLAELCDMCGETAVCASESNGPNNQSKAYAEFSNGCAGLSWQCLRRAYKRGAQESVDLALRANMDGQPLALQPENVSIKSKPCYQVFNDQVLLNDKQILEISEGLEPEPMVMQGIPKYSLSGIRGLADGDCWAFPLQKYPTLRSGAY